MKKNQLFTICLVLCSSLLSGCKTKSHIAKNDTDKSIVILFENDVHCAIENYPKIAGLRDAISDTAYVGVVSCGDYLQGGTMGAISTGKYVTDVMKTVGYDAITLGNHEFDYKVPRMKELLADIGAPVVSCNLQDSKTKEFLFAPYIIKNYGNKKVAFIGVTTPSAQITEEYAFVDEKGNEIYNLNPYKFPQLIQNAADAAKAAGADYVILLAHLGEDKSDFDSDSHTVIRKTSGIDVVLDGHTHSVIETDTVHNKMGKAVLIAQTGTKFNNVGKLYIDKKGHLSTSMVPLNNIAQENATVKHAYDVVNAQCKTFTERVLGKNDMELLVQDDKSVKVIRMQETNAGDLAADAILDYANTDLAMVNAGGIRTTIPAGELTFGEVIDLAPYDNVLNVIDIKGEKIVELLTILMQDLPIASGDFPQVAGISFSVDGTKHTVSDVKILNKQTNTYEALQNDKTYSLATLDYSISGGGFKGFLKNYTVVRSDSKTLSDMIVLYVREKLKGHVGQEYMQPKGRITIAY